MTNKPTQQRELKFRYWLNGAMHDPFVLQDLVYQGDGVNEEVCINAVFMQYTGLKDMNGKEIYEGDIVKSAWGKMYYGQQEPDELGIIKFGEHGVIASDPYCWGVAHGFYVDGFHSGDTANDHFIVEVVGNIYESPNLLENNNEE